MTRETREADRVDLTLCKHSWADTVGASKTYMLLMEASYSRQIKRTRQP